MSGGVLSRRQFAVALGAAPALAACAATDSGAREASAPVEAAPTAPRLSCTLVLVRHTEKAKIGGRNPELSEAGQARAQALASMFAHAGVTTLLHSGLTRTRDTVAPLADRLRLDSQAISPMDMDAWIGRLTEAGPDDVVVVAGHSNTVPALAWAFGVELPHLEPVPSRPELPHGYLPESAYDRVYVLTPGPDGTARLLEMRYGAPS